MDRPEDSRRGVMLVLSSPSGAGKSTIARKLIEIERGSGLELSVSLTTRPKRPSEVDNVDYRFVDRGTFERHRDTGDLLEWAEVHGNFYGTPRAPVEAALSSGRDIMFDIDWQGAEQLRANAGSDVVSVFILPPSAEDLKARLIRRAEDSPDTIERRLKNARSEMTHWADYDHVVINRDVETALSDVRSILHGERRRAARCSNLAGFVDGLIADL
ncbi:MAG: guanylate kinase [Pseudomonadota bacterium]